MSGSPLYIDDKRVCAICERVFSGRQIEITFISKNKGYLLQCPTPECSSNHRDWFSWSEAESPAESLDETREFSFVDLWPTK